MPEGKPPIGVYVLEVGALVMTVTASSGNRHALAILGPGDIFGDPVVAGLAQNGGSPDGYRRLLPEARAIISSRVLAVPAQGFEHAVRINEDVAVQLAASLVRRIDELHLSLARSLSLPLAERTLDLLNALAWRWGRPSGGGTAIGLPLTQDALASMLGATRESVNRAVRDLERAGAISRCGRFYSVEDTPGSS